MSEQEPTTLHGIFERQARLTPDAPAVEDVTGALTYAELDRRAEALATRLGPDAGPVVGVVTPRTVHTAIAVLGVLKAGAAYLPLDPAYPPARRAAMLRHSRALALVTTSGLVDGLELPDGLRIVDAADTSQAHPAQALPAVAASDLAYVIYTSGSTGEPKGVAMPHRGPVNLIRWQRGRPGARPPGRTLHFSALSFDVAMQELFDTWAGGGTIVVVDDETRRDPQRLCGALRDRQVERVFMPYVALQSMAIGLETEEPPTSLREVITAGEQLVVTPAIRSLFQRLPGCTLENQYGPTETHLVTAHVLNPDPRSWPDLPPIGQPIEGVEAHVLDHELRPVAPGTPGELYVGGVGVADGYLHRRDLTEERFLPGPAGGVMYRTGDLVTSRSGEFHFLGRADDQVKVRGHRVEPGEVEAVVAAHSGVRKAAVLARSDGSGAARLVAYVAVSTEAVDAAMLREFTAARLPAYMVPDFFHVLDDLPLTPSGKLDRRSLPDPRPSSSAGPREAPLTTTERALTDMIGEMLDLPDIGPGEVLRELGVDSISVVLLRARIRKELGADIRLAAITQAETARELAAAVDGAPTAQVDEESPLVDPEAPAPASEQQRQFWLLNRIAAGRPLYHEGLVATVDGDVDEQCFAIAVRDLATRHPVLRSVLTLKGGQLTAEPRPADEVPIAVLSIPPDELDQNIRAALRQPFDLGSEPPLRAVALRTAPHAWTLVIVVHHAATDGWSTQRIVDDFTASYDRAARGHSSMEAAAAAGYAAYAGWQLTLPQDDALAWWVRTLEGVDPELALRNARPRPGRPSYRSGRLRLSLSERMHSDVRRLAREERTSPYMVLLAAFAAAIGEVAGRKDLIIGVPAANRLLPEHQDVVGPFVNTLPLRLNVDSPRLPELVRRTQEAMVAALERQHVTIAKIVSALRLERSRSPLVQVLFTAAPRIRSPLRLGEAPVEWQFDPPGSDAAIMDLNITVHDDGDRIRADFDYAADMFDPESAREILDAWTRRLSAGTGDVEQAH